DYHRAENVDPLHGVFTSLCRDRPKLRLLRSVRQMFSARTHSQTIFMMLGLSVFTVSIRIFKRT
ncbi:MAG TPA: hypothetical protein VIE47_00120, partial [Methylocystis sp.]